MADDLKAIQGLMAKRTTLVDGLLSVLGSKVAAVEKVLLKSVVENFIDKLEQTPEGRIKNTLYNKRLLGNIDTVFTKFGNTAGVEVASTIAGGVQSIVNFSGDYYSMFTTKAKLLELKPAVKDTMSAWLGLTDKNGVAENGYLDTIIKNTTVKNTIKNFALNTVIGQQGWQQSKQALSDIIIGSGDEAGAMQKYYRNFIYDTYSQVDRATSQIYADKLGFNFYIYEGGIIKTTRSFCRERNGKVFHKTEIMLFDPEKAKQPGYNPFTDLGGYGCRHTLNGIPDSLAFMLRPDAREKFKNAVNAPAPKPVEKPKPKAVEKPKSAEPIVKPTKVDAIVNAKTAKEYLGDVLKGFHIDGVPPKISISSNLSAKQLQDYSRQVAKLFDDYFIGTSQIENIGFKSTSNAYGMVQWYSNGKIKTINFGDRFDKSRSVDFPDGATRLAKQSKSRVDAENLQISTATHEFAHAISKAQVANAHGQNFFKEVTALRKQYHAEMNDHVRNGNIDASSRLYLGKYASTNLDEFWAEAFTEFKLKKNPSKYAKLVGELANKYFKKSQL